MSRPGTLLTLFLLIISSLAVGPVAGQDLSPQQADKIDARLRAAVAADLPEAGIDAPSVRAVAPVGDPAKSGAARYAVLLRTGNGERLRAAGLPIESALPRISTARLTARQIVELAKQSDIGAIHASVQNTPLNDEAAGVTGIRSLNNGRLNNTTYTGAGVAACVIDSGIDITHRDFREIGDPSQSRILRIWDQTLSVQTGESAPDAYSYGVEYTQAEINDEIDGSPAGVVRHEDTSGHGTHVAGTMAGNGGADPERRYVGMAPEASLIIVETDFSSAGIVDGVNYCGEVAAANNLPVLANLSLGTNFGPHDGTLPQDLGISDWATAAPGRAAVISAGNSASSGLHVTGAASAGGTATIDVDVPSSFSPSSGTENDRFGIDLWFDGEPDVDITVTTPDGHTATMTFGSDATVDTPDGQVQFFQGTSAENGDYQVTIQLVDAVETQTPAAGTMTIEIANNETSTAASYHGWRYLNEISSTLPDGDAAYTIMSPGSALGAVTAGAYVHQWVWCSESSGCQTTAGRGTPNRSDDISSFSSHGPLRGVSQVKPDLAAPGEMVASSSSDDMSLSGFYVADGGKHRFSLGTSMSSPVVAGAAVLLLQEDPTLTNEEIREALRSGSRTDGPTGAAPNDIWGYGKLDAIGAMAHVLDPSATYTREVLAYDAWSASETEVTAGDAPAAVRFEASATGVLSGAMVHTGRNNAVSGPLQVELWSDDGSGLPDQKLSQTATTPGAAVQRYSWNYVDLAGLGMSVQAGTSYHLVVYASSGDDLRLLSTSTSVDGRSSLRSAGTWSGVSSDLRLRPIVTFAGVAGSLPVELADFRGQADGNRAVLSWKTVAETNNKGFVVERARESGRFSRTGFVDGAGTTQNPQSYSYTTGTLETGTYRFRLQQVDVDGTRTPGPETTVTIGLQEPFVLSQVAPNPVRARASVKLEVKTQQQVRVELFNVLGQRVRVLHDAPLAPGSAHTIPINSSDLASGIYFVRAEGETFQATRKFVRVR